MWNERKFISLFGVKNSSFLRFPFHNSGNTFPAKRTNTIENYKKNSIHIDLHPLRRAHSYRLQR